ncbi:MAG TPA: hypothetical protein DCM87_21855 [Planctomycetes bacterium]|jgi:prepilin-type N-terminal cleavage/methylation domain-containing protein|nr:hypothetical protein [Planctomycetota bacterium]
MARGFTILEMCIALAIMTVLGGAVVGMAGRMMDYLGEQDVRQAFVLDATSTFAKLDVELRESGNATIGATRYPFTASDGAELCFLRLDNPPCTFDGGTDLRWNPTEIRLNTENRELRLYEGGVRRATLITKVDRCLFTISGRAIAIDLELADADARVRDRFRRIIVMRN